MRCSTIYVIHFAADSKIMNFLEKEIVNEKEATSKVPSSNLFQVSHFIFFLFVIQSVKKK